MRKARWFIFLAPVIPASVVLGACSSGNTIGENTSGCPTPTNPTGEDPFAVPDAGATGKYGARDEVCGTYSCALLAKASELSCGLDPSPKCPDVLVNFEKNAFPGKCVDAYDLGTLDNCVKRISTYKNCADFNDRKCEIRVRLLPDSKCPGSATDSGPIDTGTDTAIDSGTDASGDVKTDGGGG